MELRGRCGVNPWLFLKNTNQQQRDLFSAVYNTQLSLSHSEQGAEQTDGFHAESCKEAIAASPGTFSSERRAFYWLFMTCRVSAGTIADQSGHESERERRFGLGAGEASVTLETEEKGDRGGRVHLGAWRRRRRVDAPSVQGHFKSRTMISFMSNPAER